MQLGFFLGEERSLARTGVRDLGLYAHKGMPVQIAGVKIKMAANAVTDVGGPGPVIMHSVADQVKKGEDFYLINAAFKAGDFTCGLYCVSVDAPGTAESLNIFFSGSRSEQL